MQYFGLLDDSRWQGWKHGGKREVERDICNVLKMSSGFTISRLVAFWFVGKVNCTC
jgi:hypothetical protein